MDFSDIFFISNIDLFKSGKYKFSKEEFLKNHLSVFDDSLDMLTLSISINEDRYCKLSIWQDDGSNITMYNYNSEIIKYFEQVYKLLTTP